MSSNRHRSAGASIPTTTGLRRVNRRLIRRSASTAQTLAAMRRGAVLQQFFEHGRAIWRLSTGVFITPEAADAITHNPNVAGGADCLFGDAGTSQTYRWIRSSEEDIA
jgi:hypothetical protein